ncbi:hypothetical protein CRYUN_Cryun28dG0043000 [Craigia yunnanensis]
MASAPSKLYADDVSLVLVLLDTNQFFWSSSSLSFSQFLSHVLAFLNGILTLNQLNQAVVIATGYNSCDYIFDLYSDLNRRFENGRMPVMCSSLLQKLEEFLIKDEQLSKEEPEGRIKSPLLSGSLSMALCYMQRVFRSGALHLHSRHTHFSVPHVSASSFFIFTSDEIKSNACIIVTGTRTSARIVRFKCYRQILCLQGSPDGPEQYVAIMNAIFSAQRPMVPIDSCYIGAQNSAFLQQASYITGGVHHKPQNLDGCFNISCAKKCLFLCRCSSKLFLLLTCILAVSYIFQSPSVYIFTPHVFAIKIPLTWATYAPYVCQFSASVRRNVQPVGQYMVRLNLRRLQHLTKRERLWEHAKEDTKVLSSTEICARAHAKRGGNIGWLQTRDSAPPTMNSPANLQKSWISLR